VIEFRIAATFTAALARLAAAEQKAKNKQKGKLVIIQEKTSYQKLKQ